MAAPPTRPFAWVRTATGWLLACFFACAAGAASAPSPAPQMRVDAAMHTGAIGQMRADWPRNRVVTVGADRTVRIWQLPSLRLVRVVRLPQEGSIEGMPIGLAVSPDGGTIAVGGWTGISWETRASIYFFDTASGRMTRRIGGFPDVVSALDWSPDGKRLAVGLGGQHGVRVLSLQDGRTVGEDTAYEGSVTFVHFSEAGLLAASASDGAVRLYDAANALVARQSVGVSKLLGGVRFSPDGKQLALGIVDKPYALLLKVPTLELAATPRQVADPQQTGMCCIAWSRDGRTLFLNGEHAGTGPTPLYRFDNAGTGSPQVLPVGNQRYSNMLPLPDGSILFATTTPSLTLVSPSGAIVRHVGTVISDFREGQQGLRISADGLTVSVPTARSGGQPWFFSVRGLGLPPNDVPLLPRRSTAPGFRLEGFGPAGPSPVEARVNGTLLAMAAGDRVTAHAFTHDGKAMFVGTTWQLVKVDSAARALWRQSFSSEVRGVNASADGRFALVTLADGTARWLRQSDGRELLAFFPHNNGNEWILWRPDGYYASSEHGDEYVGWHVNRGIDREPDFYRAVQFERLFYRPDLLRTALDAAGTQLAQGNAAPLDLEPIAPARLLVADPQSRLNARGRLEITLRVTADARTLPMRQLAVYLNGLPVTPTAQRTLGRGDSARFDRTLTIESDKAANDIRIEVDHGQSLALAEVHVESAGRMTPRDASAPRGRLIAVAVGINRFVNVTAQEKAQLPDLDYAAKDAQEFLKTMQQSSQGLFREVKSVLLNDTTELKPDKAGIEQALAVLQEAGPDDTVVVFLASHGFSDPAGNYYFMARDGRLADVQTVLQTPNAAGRTPSLIEGDMFFNALRHTAGRRVLIVDTCHARQIEGTPDIHSLRKRSAASSFAFMVAAKGNEFSQEYEAGGHGLFTYALLEAFKPASDTNGDGSVSLSEAFASLAPLVERLRARRLRQTPQLIAPPVLLEQPLVAFQGRGR